MIVCESVASRILEIFLRSCLMNNSFERKEKDKSLKFEFRDPSLDFACQDSRTIRIVRCK